MRTSPAKSRTAAALVAAGLAAALLPAAARGQFQPVRLRLPSEAGAEVVAARLSGQGGGDDLLVTRPPGAAVQRYTWHGDLLSPRAPITGLPGVGGYLAAGRLEAAAAGATEDLVYSTLTGVLVRWGAAPSSWQDLPGLFAGDPTAMGKARLLPRPEPVLVVPIQAGTGGPSTMRAVDLAAARQGGATPGLTWAVPPFLFASDGDIDTRVYPVRLSPAAVAAGVDDVVMPLQQGFFMLWHRSAPAGPALAQLDVVGVASGTSQAAAIPAWLPTGQIRGGSVLGAGVLDADGDGDRDLVFTYAHDAAVTPEFRGALLYARSDGSPASLETPPWQSLMGRPDLAGLVDPFTTRQLALDPPVLAVYDRFLGEILLLRGDGRVGFTVTSLPGDGPGAGSAIPREMFVADVVGSPAPDLVVQAVRPVVPPATVGVAEVWVYPDVGDAAPVVAFAPPAPAEVARGQDLPLAVEASDPDSTVAVTWMLGDRLSPPAAAGLSWTVPGSLLCQAGGAVAVTARATDDLGVFSEAAAAVTVVSRPTLRLAGPDPDRLTLPPGGAGGEAEGTAWPACQRSATFGWGERQLPGLVEVEVVSDATSSRRRFTLPESSYPGVLAGAPALTLTATDDLGATGQAVLPLALDAEGLVAVEVAVDRRTLARGEVALATARLRSRLAVALPAVRAGVRLDGLALVGPVTCQGAAAAPGVTPAEVILDLLPAAGSEVRLSFPVRGLGRPGQVAVELHSSGGHRLSPGGGAGAERDRLPGCGCGGEGGAGLALGLAALSLLRGPRGPRRRRGTPPT